MDDIVHKYSILLQEKRNQTINILIKQLLYQNESMSVVLNQTTCSVSHESMNPSKH